MESEKVREIGVAILSVGFYISLFSLGWIIGKTFLVSETPHQPVARLVTVKNCDYVAYMGTLTEAANQPDTCYVAPLTTAEMEKYLARLLEASKGGS